MKSSSKGALLIVLGVAAFGFTGTANAAQCMKAGGWGANLMQGVAEFMAEAALKNSAKARLGTDNPKIGPVTQKCEQKGLLVECIASAKACK